MWRRLAVVCAPSALLILVVGIGSLVADIHRHQAAQQAQQAGQAQQQERQRERTEIHTEMEMLKLKNERDQALQRLDAASARADDLQGQVDKLTNELAALQAASVGLGSGPAAQTVGATVGPVIFPYGYCTWYVATKRQVTWSGNAINWWWNARGVRPEGSQPKPGAIMVTAESIWGHVAYVESVASNGTFTVSEMNYTGWGMVDWRTILPGRVPVLGFIY